MRLVTVTVLSMSLCGCAGVAVGTFGTFEEKSSSVELAAKRGEFGLGLHPRRYTKQEVEQFWGKPDEVTSFANCDVFTYYDGFSWSGVGAFIVVVPIPLLLPSGRDETRIYFRDGSTVGRVIEDGDVVYALGYLCGDNKCGAVAGPIHENKQRKVDIDWCGQQP